MNADLLPGGAWSIAIQCDDIRPLFLDTGYFSPGLLLLSTARGEHSCKNIIAYIMMAFLGSMLWREWPNVWGFCLGGEEKQSPPTPTPHPYQLESGHEGEAGSPQGDGPSWKARMPD